MLNELYKNRLHYLFLFTGLFLGLTFFFGLFNLPSFKVGSIIGLCVFYFFWGIIHHWLEKDLHIKIVLEYLFVSLIALAILLSLIWRAQGGRLL
ncbi:hypothetical protein COT75_01185 [Candidatus Beckwithbacteria bacterium CG10_big_fil_rev_8_21_14_0_10_34_10]|uniref:Uncharacterized protein n=1 Tax=Candidatus Beckwithbacteria bacterium CG10_big_fil_rev_8_21_14_0_10_34_10 TaxID=1974495 RepID=A0A2H0WA05_9BACT|nr:MAG: hypothetical protein COT75_01185 [Candidatus Beckwithbacteria bacterium CG10_big_fil_rev_8_21_14_0_10_34_10]